MNYIDIQSPMFEKILSARSQASQKSINEINAVKSNTNQLIKESQLDNMHNDQYVQSKSDKFDQILNEIRSNISRQNSTNKQYRSSLDYLKEEDTNDRNNTKYVDDKND